MSEHEYVQNILYMRELSASDLMDFITTFFAYTVMAHFFGSSLSRGLAVMASVIYSSFAAITFFSLVDLTISIQQLTLELLNTYPNAEKYVNAYGGGVYLGLIMTVGPIFIAWLLSLYYLHFSVRSAAREHT
jgi:hypothetical protein